MDESKTMLLITKKKPYIVLLKTCHMLVEMFQSEDERIYLFMSSATTQSKPVFNENNCSTLLLYVQHNYRITLNNVVFSFQAIQQSKHHFLVVSFLNFKTAGSNSTNSLISHINKMTAWLQVCFFFLIVLLYLQQKVAFDQ